MEEGGGGRVGRSSWDRCVGASPREAYFHMVFVKTYINLHIYTALSLLDGL